MESESLACVSERGTKMWIRACNLPVPRRFSCLAKKRTKPASGAFLNANERGGLEERRPILTNGIVDACLAGQSTARRAEN